MNKVAIVADTCVVIPQELVDKYGIQLIPMLFHLENKTYTDTVDIKTPDELFQLVKKSSKFPTTSAPSPGRYAELYRQLSRQAEGILSVTVSSEMSASFKSATQAKEVIETELPHTEIQAFDSRTTASGMGLVVLAAARAAASGQDMKAVVKVAEDIKSKVNHFGIFDSLSWLVRSGRISKAAAMVGNMLSMKPIGETSQGRHIVVARPRTRKKAIQVLLEIVKQRVGTTSPLHIIVEHTSWLEEAERLKQMVLDQFNCAEVFLCEYTPVVSLIVGPGVVGLGFYQE